MIAALEGTRAVCLIQCDGHGGGRGHCPQHGGGMEARLVNRLVRDEAEAAIRAGRAALAKAEGREA